MDWSSVISSGVQAGGSLGAEALNYYTSFERDKRALKQNKELADYQYSKELDMWNRQNEYNSPASQMARYQEAGLNPNLIYGQGSSGNAVSLPHYQAPEYRPSKTGFDISVITNVLSQYMEVANMAQQNKILEAEARIRQADALYAENNAWYKNEITLNEKELSKMKKLMTENEFNEVFEPKVIGQSDGWIHKDMSNWIVKDKYVDVFRNYVRSKYLYPDSKLQESQNDAKIKGVEAELREMVKKLGMASPIIQAIIKGLF